MQVDEKLLTTKERPLIILEGVTPLNQSAVYPEFSNYNELTGCFVYQHDEGVDWKEGLTAFFQSVSTNTIKPSGYLSPEEVEAKVQKETEEAKERQKKQHEKELVDAKRKACLQTHIVALAMNEAASVRGKYGALQIQQIDSDNDGQVDAKEFELWVKGRMNVQAEAWAKESFMNDLWLNAKLPEPDDFFAAVDQNGDGFVTASEIDVLAEWSDDIPPALLDKFILDGWKGYIDEIKNRKKEGLVALPTDGWSREPNYVVPHPEGGVDGWSKRMINVIDKFMAKDPKIPVVPLNDRHDPNGPGVPAGPIADGPVGSGAGSPGGPIPADAGGAGAPSNRGNGNVFAEINTDGDNYLTEGELEAWIKNDHTIPFTASVILSHEDKNKDGRISWDEFTAPKGQRPPDGGDGGGAGLEDDLDEL